LCPAVFPQTAITSPIETLEFGSKLAAIGVVGRHPRERVAGHSAHGDAVREHVRDVIAGVRAMVKVWFRPEATLTGPLGLIVPPVPAEAVIVKLDTAKLALMVWPAVTPVNT